jgi:signal transduction histidine kinase
MFFRFPSIMSRIAFLHIVAVVIIAIVMPIGLYALLNVAASNLHHRVMRQHAEAIAENLKSHEDGSWSLPLPIGLRDFYSEAYGRYVYSVVDEGGRVLVASRKELSPIFSEDKLLSHVEDYELRRGGRLISGSSIPKDIAGKKIWIQVAEDFSHRDALIDDILADFFRRVGWIVIPLLLLLLVADLVIFRRALRPLREASLQAQQIGPTRTDIRLPTKEMPNEIVPLVQAVNQAFARLEHGFRIQRDFTADAAHELRTPLAVLRTRVDTGVDPAIRKELQKDIETMSRMVSQLLDIAELDASVVEQSEKADLRAVCSDVAEAMAPLALAQQKNISLKVPDTALWVQGNAEMLKRAVRNLVENAIRHTPDGTEVEIVLDQSGMVSVLDQGEGIPASERELIFQRFWRRDHRQAGSSGLGLSIVQRIVEAHRGTIAVKSRPTGGTDFSLQFAVAEGGQETRA